MPHTKEQHNVLVVSTSFPLHKNSVSGIFVERLVRALSKYCILTVITSCASDSSIKASDTPYFLSCFRYAPRSWQVLAHEPGGIFTAIRRNYFLLILVPGLVLSLFFACLLKAKGKQIIFANWSICGFIAGVVGWLRGIPVITTLRGSDVNLVKHSFFNHWLLAFTIALSHRTVTVSAALARVLTHRYPQLAGRIRMIPNGVDDSLLYLERLPPRSEVKLRLVFIGNLIPLKGVDTILRALAVLPPDISLKIVGEGVQRKALEELGITSGINQQVVFTGALPPESIPTILRESDALILASHSEGRPNVVLESLAAGLTVIATNIEGTSELVIDGQTGLLFPPGDTDALRSCIERLYLDPVLCRRLGERGREWIREQGLFWQNTAAAYAGLFEEVISGNPRR